MALSFVEKLKNMSMSKFQFESFEKKMTENQDGTRVAYLVFHLSEPIEKVVGSGVVRNPDNYEEMAHVTQTDITEVRCKLDVIEQNELEFTFDEDANGDLVGTGTYKGQLELDVAKGSGDVWLVDEKFSTFGNKMRNDKRKTQFQTFFTKAKS